MTTSRDANRHDTINQAKETALDVLEFRWEGASLLASVLDEDNSDSLGSVVVPSEVVWVEVWVFPVGELDSSDFFDSVAMLPIVV